MSTVRPGLRATVREWPALLVLALVSGLYVMLADGLTAVLPGHPLTGGQASVTSLSISAVLVLAVIAGWATRSRKVVRAGIFAYASVVTLYMLSGVVMLVMALPSLDTGKQGLVVLQDAFVVWAINVIIFAVWYWLLDGGGPWRRLSGEAGRSDFLFPQQTNKLPGWENWKPAFSSYLFVAFFACATFGPTDSFPLSRRAKILMAVQSLISFVTFTMIVARALSIIT